MSSGLDAELDLRSQDSPEPDLEVIVGDDDGDLYEDNPYDDDDWGLSDVQADAVYDAVAKLVEAGPTTLEALVEALTGPGHPLSHVEADEADDLLLQLLVDIPGVWQHRSSVARIEHLLEGRAFTHRLTATDLLFGGLESDPDLAVLGCTSNTSTLADGTELASTEDPDTGWHGYVGPPGWLHNFQLDDLVALRYGAGRWSLEAVPEPSDGSAETGALLEGLAPALDAGRGDELLNPILNALSDGNALFRTPVLPASELLTAAGLLRDGPFIGPADQIWYPHHATLDLRTLQVASQHDVAGCCLAALRRVATRWRAHELGLAALPGVPLTAEAVSALGHEGVATALADLMALPRAADRAALFVDELLDAAPEAAGPLALAGAVADRLTRHGEAEERYRQALAIDSTTPSATIGLAWQAFDRGDLATAGRLLRQALGSGHRYVKLVGELARTLPEPGRNAPCPCGSSRKYKTCHLGRPVVTSEARPVMLLSKLARFASGSSFDTFRLQLLAAGSPRGGPNLKKLASELQLFDPYTASAYRRARGGLLPAEELALLDRIIETPLRLVEVASLHPDGAAVFQDSVTGKSILCRLPLTEAPLAPGDVGLARVIDGELVGSFAPVPKPENRVMLRSLLAEHGNRSGGQVHLIPLLAALDS